MPEYGSHRLRPSQIRFGQDSIAGRFTCGIPIWQTFEEIINGKITPDNIPKMEVAYVDGSWWASSGNRRLYIYKKLEELNVISTIPVFYWSNYRHNFTTDCEGRQIRCRQPIANAKIEEIINKWKNNRCVSNKGVQDPGLNMKTYKSIQSRARPQNYIYSGQSGSADIYSKRMLDFSSPKSKVDGLLESQIRTRKKEIDSVRSKTVDEYYQQLNRLRNLSLVGSHESSCKSGPQASAYRPTHNVPSSVQNNTITSSELKPKAQDQFKKISIDDDRYYIISGNQKVLVTRQYGG